MSQENTVKGSTAELAKQLELSPAEMGLILRLVKKKDPSKVKTIGSGPKPKRGRTATIYEINRNLNFSL